ncbi:MAG: hypothetical protein V2A69_14125 [Pseudomonadota bacterium]
MLDNKSILIYYYGATFQELIFEVYQEWQRTTGVCQWVNAKILKRFVPFEVPRA